MADQMDELMEFSVKFSRRFGFNRNSLLPQRLIHFFVHKKYEMKKFLLPAIIALFSFKTIADEWKTVTLIDKVTVSLPGTATEDRSKGIPMQKVVLADSTEIDAFALDYSTFGLTEQTLQQMAGTDAFKQQMETGISMQPGVKLVKNESGKFADKYTSYKMVLGVDKDGYKGTVNQQTVFYKQYGITLIYKPGKKGEDAALRDKLFSSLKIAE